MNRLVRTELLKQRTTRTGLAVVAAAPVAAALVAVAVLDAAGKHGNEPLGSDSLTQALGAPASVVTVLALLGGILAMAGEHRHATITTTFLATPRRREVVTARLAAQALVGAAMGLLSLAAAAAVALPWLSSSEVAVRLDAEVLGVAAGLVASTALHGALGVAVGALVRNQTAAVAAVLVWVLAVEGLVGDLFTGSGIADWLPAAAGRALVHAEGDGAGPSALAAAAALTAEVAALAAAATRLTVRRDVT
jgi:ABC-2 type transport system permease protein